jgi:hypothetical protein
MIDAFNLNYQILMLRDCAMAIELPHETKDLAFTQRMILWTEYSVGFTTTSEAFIAACDSAQEKK